MAKIAYLLLCHKDPDGVIRQARRLTAAGDRIAIHFDGRASDADFARIRATLGANPRVTFAARRIRCGWGEWSLVEATLEAARAALAAFPGATHFYMLSGDCMAIKPAEYAHALLDAEPADYIESFDFHTSGWIKIGMREERLIYRHFFNERKNKRLFYAALEAQRRLGLRRAPPADLRVMIGSQWWCLRRATLEAVLAFCARRPEVVRFFRTTWIPDETFFQTLVRHLVPEAEIRSRTLTFLMFTDYGMPVTFCNDHFDLLLEQDYLFARKISPAARALQLRLGDLYASTGREVAVSGGGRARYGFLAGQGRVGRRFAPRIWEHGARLSGDHTLLMVVCKDWDLGRRLVGRIREVAGLPAFGYVFNYGPEPMPDLGGIEAPLEKRLRHRRAVVRLMFETLACPRLLLCVDPGDYDLVQDLAGSGGTIRLLEVEWVLDERFLSAHAARLGIAAPDAPPERLAGMLATVRLDINSQFDRLRNAGLPGFHRIAKGATQAENAVQIAAFLGVEPALCQTIVNPEGLFTITEVPHAI